MYNITREEASQILDVSVRSIDRYIKSWKLRSQKDWKNVLIHFDDINTIKSWWKSNKQEIINPSNNINSTELSTNSSEVLDNIYADLKEEIKEKDKLVTDLSFKLWEMKEIAKQSITIAEHNQNKLLLEESKQAVEQELENKYKETLVLKKKFKDEKYANLILIIISLVLFVMLAFVWYSKI